MPIARPNVYKKLLLTREILLGIQKRQFNSVLAQMHRTLWSPIYFIKLNFNHRMKFLGTMFYVTNFTNNLQPFHTTPCNSLSGE